MTPMWLKFFACLLVGVANTAADQCLTSPEYQKIRTKPVSGYSDEIVIQVSNNVLHQINSRIFGTYVKEMLNFDVKYEDIKYYKDPKNMTEKEKLFDILELIKGSKKPILNLNVWMPADYHGPPPNIEMVGRFSTGRYGWFIPKALKQNDKLIPYTIFKNTSSEDFDQFVLDPSLFNESEIIDKYEPDHCQYAKCATLLSGDPEDTIFTKAHINELKLFTRILWLGDNLHRVTHDLLRTFSKSFKKQSFIVLHWTPSEIVDTDIEYDLIIMPRSEQFINEESQDTLSKYELTPILKYCSPKLRRTLPVHTALTLVTFNRGYEKFILEMYNNATDLQLNGQMIQTIDVIDSDRNKEMIYDQIACQFLRTEKIINELIIPSTNVIVTKRKVFIGGLYPKREEAEKEHTGIAEAVRLAENDIRANGSILSDIELVVNSNNDGCHLDKVMRSFINYYVRPEGVLGVLGPPCSETVEPVAGLSKHIHMAVISYSAEGVSFKNREKYPYFFRTIGENRQYEHVYVRLLKQLNWRRVVAFTEDGQKYTEYISQLENVLRENDIELTNKKFSKDISPDKIRNSLQDLKSKNSKIIIADIYDNQAGVVLCEAFKLQMSAKDGYVWFLPIWLDKDSSEIHVSSNVNCTQEQISEMLDGHFSLAHAPYASDGSLMETNRTVGDWKSKYGLSNSSHYGSYAYDAVWVYALALDKLLKESPTNLATLHSANTTERFVQIISESDFNGVSGRIRFGEGGTRFSTINIIQWLNNENHVVGTFEPTISQINSTRIISGGNFNFSADNIKWFTSNGEIPDDGTDICSVSGLAKLLGYDCSHTLVIITALLCSLLVIMVSAFSFIFWKRRYDKKLKASAKLMRNFGIDLLSMSPVQSNTLDKWELSKDRVVINRRLGEGAFGTVYGGEAQIDDHGWTAVAVKTLKKGSNTEDRLDFLSEAEAMKRFDHANVIKLLGVCLQTEPIYAIMEFMLYGDLKTYLLARRHLVNEKTHDDSDISPKRLTMMALDIARALSYLSEMKYVHRDVACRNCLVNAQRVVKLADFGMARSTSENDYYRFTRKGMLPVRWMAPESLSFGKFTPASDIWSFGVLLFEIITFGSFPFQGMTNNQVLDHIKEGNILTIPNGIKPQLEGLMKACWSLSYIKRPTALEVVEFISNYPKLVTPSLDVPLASVQIPETDSDQLELLPGLRKVVTTQTEEPAYNNMSIPHTPNGIALSNFDAFSDDFTITMTRNPSNTYNPIEPLLMYDSEIGDNNNSLRRYVPMCGYKKGNVIECADN